MIARDCNRCHHIEIPTAETLFHRVRFGLRKAFGIVFEMSATTKGLSSSQVARRYEISRPTTWAFMHKVRNAMQSSKKHPLEGEGQVDEFVYGGKENLKQGRSTNAKRKKLIGAVELTDKGKIKRAYFKKIANYSSVSLSKIFEEHISDKAQVMTDKWTGYGPLSQKYHIEQKYSEKGGSMKQMHTVVHQLKSWLRSIYSWGHEAHIEKYLDEFSFWVTRSKQNIFHLLIQRMIDNETITYQMIKIIN